MTTKLQGRTALHDHIVRLASGEKVSSWWKAIFMSNTTQRDTLRIRTIGVPLVLLHDLGLPVNNDSRTFLLMLINGFEKFAPEFYDNCPSSKVNAVFSRSTQACWSDSWHSLLLQWPPVNPSDMHTRVLLEI